MSIITKYRPSSWNEFKGNEALITSLRNELKKEDRPHAYLFHGMTGVGKSTLSRLIAKELGCSDQNIIELNIADNTSVEHAREIARSAKYVPLVQNNESKIKVYILDEFQRASPQAQDCLLKPLEEPPEHAYFIICTTEPSKVVKTIRSRCSEYEVRPIDHAEMIELLEDIAEKEEVEVDYKVLNKIAKVSEGRAREAISLLGQVSEISDVNEALELITLKVENSSIIELCKAMLAKKKWKEIAILLSRLQEDPEKCRLAILNYFASIMVNPKSGESTVQYSALVAECFESPFYNSGRGGLILACYKACMEG